MVLVMVLVCIMGTSHGIFCCASFDVHADLSEDSVLLGCDVWRGGCSIRDIKGGQVALKRRKRIAYRLSVTTKNWILIFRFVLKIA
jgi:hypothetical protein